MIDVRSGIDGAIAAQFLSCENIEAACVIGAGTQARYQIQGLKLVREFNRLMVCSIIPEEVDADDEGMSIGHGVEVAKVGNWEEVARQSGVAVTTTPSREPFLKAECVHPDLHVTCKGSDSEHKQELYADVIEWADE